jgi:hypothetical protein
LGAGAIVRNIIEIRVERKGEHFVGEVQEFGIYCDGRNLDELVRDAEDWIAFIWREYVEADPRELAGDALVLRKNLMARFG